MTFPAYVTLEDEITAQTGKDLRRGFARWRVYRYLRPPTLDFREARNVKVEPIRTALHISPNAVVDALDWLTERGYLIEEGRTGRMTRLVRLAWDIQPRTT